jgi:pimeloyl-ACP methyl ester carboxylesterase
MNSSSPGGIVLIHSGEHGAWCWDRLLALLSYPTLALDLPGRGSQSGELRAIPTLNDFIEHATTRINSTSWRNIVAVAHSLGGLTASGLVAQIPGRVSHLVLVSCALPASGQRAIDSAPHGLRGFLEWGFRRGLARGGMYKLPRTVARYLFCNDLNPQDSRTLLDARCREPASVIFETADYAEELAVIPKTWVYLPRDRAIRPRTQDRMIGNIGNPDVVKLQSVCAFGHVQSSTRIGGGGEPCRRTLFRFRQQMTDPALPRSASSWHEAYQGAQASRATPRCRRPTLNVVFLEGAPSQIVPTRVWNDALEDIVWFRGPSPHRNSDR